MARHSFSGRTYLSFEQTEMAMKATWINEWLDEGRTVLGRLGRGEPAEYAPIREAIQPRIDSIECVMEDGTTREIFGYKMQ
jgi:hypothetical protein